MKYKKYYATLNREQKKTLAERLHTSPEYLAQLNSGMRYAGLKIVRAIEPATDGVVAMHELPLKPLPSSMVVSF